jgi:hypothetical protein
MAEGGESKSNIVLQRIFWDSLLILTVLVWILRLVAEGYLSEKAGAIFLVLLVFFISFIRVRGSIGRLIRLTFRVALPIASLASLSAVYGSGSVEGAITIFFMIAPLLIALIGFYVMFGGPFHRK